jgi:PmbA protein
MIGQEKIFTTIERIMAASKADQTEAVVVGESNSLTRYANSYIHQSVAVENATVTFRVALGNRLGIASCNSLGSVDLRRALRAAVAIARKQKPNPDFEGFAGPAEYRRLSTLDPATAAFTPKQRAGKLKRVFARGSRYGYDMAGSFATGAGEVAVLNSNGVRCYQPYTGASLTVIATGPDSSGYAEGYSRSVAEIEASGLAAAAVEKCRKSKSPKELSPGDYEVILEPPALAEIMGWLSFIAFGSKAFEEGTSCLAGRMGQRLMGENVTIADDAFEPANLGLAFDFEGVPRRRVELISRGVAAGVVHDRLSARRAGKPSTGHALPAGQSTEGAVPLNLQLAAGSQSLEELIGGVEDGLLVTRFHYLNGFLEPRTALMTGMTRDGLFRIKGGRLAGGVKNLRFTDSMLEVFSHVLGLSAERRTTGSGWGAIGGSCLPAVRLARLRFTGRTEF